MNFQAKLTTKIEKYSVKNTVIELKSDVNKESLNHVVKHLLVEFEHYEPKDLETINFDFILGDKLLQLSVEQHLELYTDEINAAEILSEKIVELEYFLSFAAPEPVGALPHEDWVSCVDANETHIVSGSYDNSIRIFTIHDRKCVLTILDAHKKPVCKIRWIKQLGDIKKNELYFVSSGHDEISIVRRFDIKKLKAEVVFIYKGHNRSVNCVDVQDDIVATGSFDKTLRLWSANLDESQADESENLPQAGEKSTNKKQKTKVSEKGVDKATRSAIMTLTGHQESITGVKWLSNCNEYNSVATCSMDRSICIWDIEVGECKRKLLSAKPLLNLDYNKERNLIIGASCDRHIRLWDARASENCTAMIAFTSTRSWISSLAFSKTDSNHFISGGYDNMVKLWDLRSTKACLYDMIGHHDKVLDVNWSNPKYVISGSADSSLKVFATK